MNNTPKTDAVEHELHHTWTGASMRKCMDGGWVEADFARELERENTKLRETMTATRSQNPAVSELTPAGYACLDTIQEIITKLGGSNEICLAVASLGNSHPDEGVLDELRHQSALLANVGDERRA